MLKTKCIAIALTAVILLNINSISHAGLNAYLFLEGESQGTIDGECTIHGNENAIVVHSYYHKLASVIDNETGLPTGDHQHKPLVITKQVDGASPLLLQAWASNEKMTRFSLIFHKINSEGYDDMYYTIDLEDAQIVGITQYKPTTLLEENDPYGEMEQVSFTYSKIKYIHYVAGTDRETNWDYTPGTIPEDISGDGIVNMTDLAMLASQWLTNN